jgi:hypothetical protein
LHKTRLIFRNQLVKFTGCGKQGDQIGRIFDHWVIVYFGQLFENYHSSPTFLGQLFPQLKFLVLAKKHVGLRFGRLKKIHQVTLSESVIGKVALS